MQGRSWGSCRSRLRWAVWLGAVFAAGCQRREHERPPPIADCTTCPVTPIGSRASGGVTPGADASLNDAPASDAGAGPSMDVDSRAGGVMLSGRVLEVATQNLSESRAFEGGAVRIVARDAQGLELETSATSDASYAFDAAFEPPVWLLTESEDASLHLGGLQVSAEPASDFDLRLVRRDVVEELLLNLSAPVTLDPSAGHALLHVVDAFGAPAIGVRVNAAPAQVVAYDAGDTFSDLLSTTDARGAILLVNLPASEFPGRKLELSLSDGSETLVVSVPIVHGAMTFSSTMR